MFKFEIKMPHNGSNANMCVFVITYMCGEFVSMQITGL